LEKSFRSGFIAIVGRPNVGKSTLLNRILGQKIAITSNKPQTTRNRILGIHNLPSAQVLFLDTPGIHKAKGRLNRYMVEQALWACKDVDAVFFLVEAGDSVGGGDEFILKTLSAGKAPVVLVINKIDTVEKSCLLAQIDAYSKLFDFRAIVPVSAIKGQGVDDLVKEALSLLPEGPRYYSEDMVTDLPERFIAAEMIREKVFRRTRQEIPYGVGVQVENFEEKPEKNLVVIQAAILVPREGHKGILLGKQGGAIREIGIDARGEIERFLGCRVFLELFVKVKKDWTESERLIRELGYE